MSILSQYAHWLHLRWPAGRVEPLPEVNDDGTCNVRGVYIIGDLTGVPLLKFALDSGARAVQRILLDGSFQADRAKRDPQDIDVLIVGAGVSGVAAAVTAAREGLSFKILEATRPFNTIADFPAGKPIYTYPLDFDPQGEVKVTATVKEALLEELEAQRLKFGIQPEPGRVTQIDRAGGALRVKLESGQAIKTLRVIIAIGRTGNFRQLGVPGENLPHVLHRLHDPTEHKGKSVLVIGGGDSALETAIALVNGGAQVTLSYRKKELARAKPENIEMIQRLAVEGAAAHVEVATPSSERVTTASGPWMREPSDNAHALTLALGTEPTEIREKSVTIKEPSGATRELATDAVYLMVGREAPLDFFRRSGIAISGESSTKGWVISALFLFLAVFVYAWKSGGPTERWLDPWPGNMSVVLSSLGSWWSAQIADRATLLGTLAVSMKSRSFYYTLAYSLAVVVFGLRRIRRRRTPYVTVQTCTLMAIQVVPLFLLPELILPWLGYNGCFSSGFGLSLADKLFELYIPLEQYTAGMWPEWGHPRAYWRAYGFILAWPLMVYNVFTPTPMWWWLGICTVQTFVLIPALVYYFGKGAYCGWICSCGALAETAGDTLRTRMPHGPSWNRLNVSGQLILGVAFVLLALRIASWVWPASMFGSVFNLAFDGKGVDGHTVNYLSYKWLVDVTLAGIVGVGLYLKFSGRVWCRFFCPLAALMHIYARFSRFRIFAEKSKCISCNVCTSVCHQGIDIMNFANKGIPMSDPQCVRCSACVQSCPTGVLAFGRVGKKGLPILDSLAASRYQMQSN